MSNVCLWKYMYSCAERRRCHFLGLIGDEDKRDLGVALNAEWRARTQEGGWQWPAAGDRARFVFFAPLIAP